MNNNNNYMIGRTINNQSLGKTTKNNNTNTNYMTNR